MTGASGLVGAALCALATKDGHDVFAGFNSTRPLYGKPTRLALSGADDVVGIVRAVEPEVIIHTAALTDVDQCEQQVELAERVNGIATGEIGEAARNVGAHVTYVSTDYVFSGEEGNYGEETRPNPLSEYGRSKLLGEKLLAESGAACCVGRASVIYGWGKPQKPNFALFVLKALERKREVKAAFNLYCSPTLNTNLAEMLLELAKRRLTGVFHVSGATRVSRFEFSTELAKQFGMDSKFIMPVDWRTLNLDAIRPRDSSLNVSKAMKTLNVKPLDLAEALSLFRKSRASAI